MPERSAFTVHPPTTVLHPLSSILYPLSLFVRDPVSLRRGLGFDPPRVARSLSSGHPASDPTSDPANAERSGENRSARCLSRVPRAWKPPLRLVYSGASSSMRVCRSSVGRLSTRMRATRNVAYSTLAGCREIRHNAWSPTTRRETLSARRVRAGCYGDERTADENHSVPFSTDRFSLEISQRASKVRY